jgi:hypothetical protein
MKQRDGEQAEQRDLRIDQEFSRTHVQPIGKREPALQPCPRGPWSALKLIDLPMHCACAHQKHRIVRDRAERLRAVGHGELLGIVGAQGKHEPESVQQARAHRMLRSFVEQRVRSLERALCLVARAKRSGSGKAVKRSGVDLQCRALRTIRHLLEHRQRAFGDSHALFGAEVRKSGFGGFGVVANGGGRIAASLEMRGELGGGDRHSGGALSLQGSAHFPVKLGPRRW